MSDREVSQNSSGENDDCVMFADNQEAPPETMDDSMNTQAVLNIDPPPKPKNKGKGIGKKTLSLKSKHLKTVKNHPFIRWLENMWQSEVTLRVMKPWLEQIQREALVLKNQNLYKIGNVMQKIMKEFIIWLKQEQKDLMNCSYGLFEDWFSNVGLSTTYGKCLQMDWVPDLEDTLFNLYSMCVIELEKRQEQINNATSSDEEEEEPQLASSSSRNMKNTSTSSMTVHTADQRVDAVTFNDFENTLLKEKTTKNSKDGKAVKRVAFQMEKSLSKKPKILKVVLPAESGEESDHYEPGNLFKSTQMSVEDESDAEIDITVKSTMKPITKNKKHQNIEEIEEEDPEAGLNDEDFVSMVGNLAAAHSLVSSTGKISSNISIKDGDHYINMSTPEESGVMLVKLELYPFKDCAKIDKTMWWKQKTFSAFVVISSETSPVHRLTLQLRKEITQRVMTTKKVKVEKKKIIGWKSG